MNPEKPISAMIAAHHDRTVGEVVRALGYRLADLDAGDEELLLASSVMNRALQQHVESEGAAHTMWRIEAGS